MSRLLLSKTLPRKKCQGRNRHKFRPEKNFKHPSDSRKLLQEFVNRLRFLRCFAVTLYYMHSWKFHKPLTWTVWILCPVQKFHVSSIIFCAFSQLRSCHNQVLLPNFLDLKITELFTRRKRTRGSNFLDCCCRLIWISYKKLCIYYKRHQIIPVKYIK